tara:strand:- start:329 stop:649 length:321 start_codon:yes stop_codon:yes gene_type:complete
MATRNPANEVQFNVVNFGTEIQVWNVAGMTTNPNTEAAPGEDMEALVEAVQMLGTVLGCGKIVSGGGTHAFNIYVEQSSWTQATIEAAIQATAGIFASATVTAGDL